MGSSSVVHGAAVADALRVLSASQAAVLFSNDQGGRAAAEAVGAGVRRMRGSGVEVALWLPLAAYSAPWVLVQHLIVAGVPSSATVAVAQRSLPAATPVDSAAAALAALASVEAALARLQEQPLTKAVLLAAGSDAGAAVMAAAAQAGSLEGRMWLEARPVAATRGAASNATVRDSVAAAVRGRLALCPRPSTTSSGLARRAEVASAWSALPWWRDGLPAATNGTVAGLLDAWSSRGFAVRSGTTSPRSTSVTWVGVFDAMQAALAAVGRACGPASCSGAGSRPSRSAVADALGRAALGADAPLVPARWSALGAASSPTVLGPSAGLDMALVSDSEGVLGPTSTWEEVARWRMAGASAAPAGSSSPSESASDLYSASGAMAGPRANSSAVAVPLPVGAAWWWPGSGRLAAAPDLSVSFRLGMARRLRLNVTEASVAAVIAGMSNLSATLPRVLLHFNSDAEQLRIAASRPLIRGSAAAVSTASDVDQLFVELESLADRGFHLIVSPGEDGATAAAAAQMAARKPDATFLLLRDGVSTVDQPPNLVTVRFSEDQPAFVAGAAAAALCLAASGAPVVLPGATGGVRSRVAARDLDGDGQADTIAERAIAVVHGRDMTTPERRVLSGFASGVQQVCPSCVVTERTTEGVAQDGTQASIEAARAAALLAAALQPKPKVALVAALPAGEAAAVAVALAEAGIAVIMSSSSALAAASATLGGRTPAADALLVGSVRKSVSGVVQLVAKQRYDVQTGAVAPSRRLQFDTPGPWGHAAASPAVELQPIDGGWSGRRSLQTSASAAQPVTFGLSSGAVGFVLAPRFLADAGNAATAAAARSAAAWAEAGLTAGQLDTEVFVASGAPYLQASSCQVGEEFRQGPGGNPQLAQCFKCPETTFSLVRGAPCSPCPAAAICEGGAHVAARFGHWVADDMRTLYQCNAYSCCIRGNCSHPGNPALSLEEREEAAQTRCHNGRTGLLCGSCPGGEVLVSEANGCGRCERVQWIPVGAFIGLCSVFVLYMLLRNHDARSASLSIAIDFMNSALLVFSPARQFEFTISFGVATMELTGAPFSRECIVPMPPLLRFVSTFFIPVTLLAVLATAWLYMFFIRCVCGGRGSKYSWGAWRLQMVLWVIITIAYSAFSRVGVEAITCRSVDGVAVVATAPDIRCDGTPYAIMAASTAIVAFATLFGVPLLVYATNISTLRTMGVHNAAHSVHMAARVARSATDALQIFVSRARRVRKRIQRASVAGQQVIADGAVGIDADSADAVRGPEATKPTPDARSRSDSTQRRASIAWQEQVSRMRAEVVGMEMTAIGAPRASVVNVGDEGDEAAPSGGVGGAGDGAGGGAAAAAAAGGPKRKARRRRLSALGVDPAYSGWIFDNVSNGYFWVHGEAGKDPSGPFFVHPSFAADGKGGPGSSAVGVGRGIDWDLVPQRLVDIALQEGAEAGVGRSKKRKGRKAKVSKAIAAALDPQSGELVAVDFSSEPPFALLDKVRRRSKTMNAAVAVTRMGTRTPSQAWGEDTDMPKRGSADGGRGSGTASPDTLSVHSKSQRTILPARLTASAAGVDLQRLQSDASTASGGPAAAAAAGARPRMQRAHTSGTTPAEAAKPPRAGRGRRGSILNDPDKLRRAMALTMMSGRVSGAAEQLRKLVEEVQAEGGGDDDDDAHADTKAAAAPLDMTDVASAGAAGFSLGLQASGRVESAALSSKDGVPSHVGSDGSSPRTVHVASTVPFRAVQKPAKGAAGKAGAKAAFALQAGARSIRRIDPTTELKRDIWNNATIAAKRANILNDDPSMQALRLDKIPPHFRGTARLLIPFRAQFRSTGYAVLLLRRGLATLAFVLLSQQPAVKQAVLFLYFMGWLFWQIARAPFQEPMDNKFAAVSLAVVVATAGLELHFISQVEGPSWVTWAQLVLLAAPFLYILVVALAELLDLLDERSCLPRFCQAGKLDKDGKPNTSSGLGRLGQRAGNCCNACGLCVFPRYCRRCCRRRLWCVCQLVGCVTCRGSCCCCCKRWCAACLAAVPRQHVSPAAAARGIKAAAIVAKATGGSPAGAATAHAPSALPGPPVSHGKASTSEATPHPSSGPQPRSRHGKAAGAPPAPAATGPGTSGRHKSPRPPAGRKLAKRTKGDGRESPRATSRTNHNNGRRP